MKTSKALLITLPVELVDLVDGIRGDVPRTVWIKRAVEAAVMPAVGESVREILAALPTEPADDAYDQPMSPLALRELYGRKEPPVSTNPTPTNLQQQIVVGTTRKRMIRDGKSGAPMQVREKLVRYDKGEPVWKVEG